ncbi:MAG: cobyric acid synthase [Proteobacteria bacterium]|nr:cobyric acid synthase [Pseudomonadota bacterium]
MSSSQRIPAKCLAILGTGSDVGKSVVVTALCRIFSDLQVRVAPFKAQNMSNNSFVTPEAGEMGRAQVAQAEAARVNLHVDMNPVLLKPCTDTGAQVVLHGKPIGNSQAADYFADTDYLFRQARASLARLHAEYDLVIMEGAGSCAEVNLFHRDFVNFRMAEAADAPVVLVADIDRGGVFAQLVGTLEVIPREYRERVRGFIINRFRGDAALFREGIEYLENRTGLPSLGLIPYYRHIEIDSEDGVPLDILIDPPAGPEPGKINIAVLRFPHISNFTDFAPLAREPSVILHYLSRPRPLEGFDAVFLPGSKNVRADLDWLRREGWDARLRAHIGRGGRLVGICGGYQMLGRVIRDPDGLEGEPGQTEGLGLLDVETTLHREKLLSRSAGFWEAGRERVEGYEIHMGVTDRIGGVPHVIRVTERSGKPVDETDGAGTPDGRIWGTYFHGIFDLPGFRRSLLGALDPGYRPDAGGETAVTEAEFRDRQYDLLAAHFRKYLDLPKLIEIIGVKSAERL